MDESGKSSQFYKELRQRWQIVIAPDTQNWQ